MCHLLLSIDRLGSCYRRYTIIRTVISNFKIIFSYCRLHSENTNSGKVSLLVVSRSPGSDFQWRIDTCREYSKPNLTHLFFGRKTPNSPSAERQESLVSGKRTPTAITIMRYIEKGLEYKCLQLFSLLIVTSSGKRVYLHPLVLIVLFPHFYFCM